MKFMWWNVVIYKWNGIKAYFNAKKDLINKINGFKQAIYKLISVNQISF